MSRADRLECSQRASGRGPRRETGRALARILRRFCREESGASMIEFVLVLGVFLLLFFALIDFGRLYHSYVMAEKALQIAARTAAVRPAVCAGLPETNVRPSGAGTTVRFGSACSTSNACFAPADVVCQGVATNPTAQEIWTRIAPIMPADATVADLWFRYSYDANLGFLGGPYVPVLTVEMNGSEATVPLEFEFVSPLGALAGLAAGSASASTTTWEGFAFPRVSISLPAEDLNLGQGG